MLDQVIDIDEFNSKAHARKLQYLFESGQLDKLKRCIKMIRLQPSCHDEFVRQTCNKLEKSLNEQTKKDLDVA
jgi:ribonucleotide reductase beta subunit family protein with ferritin-like domain